MSKLLLSSFRRFESIRTQFTTSAHIPQLRAAYLQARPASDWSSQQYLKFQDERTTSVRDLLAKVPLTNPKHIIDLGCGPGNSTEVLVQRYGDASIEGMDSSTDMLNKARQTLPNVKFTQADLETYVPDSQTDLLFSNAVFQWLPANSRLDIMRRLLKSLRGGGVLAIQVPDNYHQPSHASMRTVAEQGPWAAKLRERKPELPPFPSPREIYHALIELSSRVTIWHTWYYYILKDHQAVVEWVKGTGLRPFIDPLEVGDREKFIEQYLDLIRKGYEPLSDGRVMLAYPRLFVVAVRK